MATPTRKSASARLRTKHQLWLLFLRSIFSMAAATSRLVEMMRPAAMLRITPISLGLISLALWISHRPGDLRRCDRSNVRCWEEVSWIHVQPMSSLPSIKSF